MQKKIQQKQNETRFLKCQFAAKYNYNKAGIMSKIVWLCCFLSALAILIPDKNPWGTIGVPLLIDTIGLAFEICFHNSISKAALLRNYFDAQVLSLNDRHYSEAQERAIKNIIEKTCNKHQKKCEVQIKNNSSDTPPGVKDWYEFSHAFSEDDIQYECQRQNCYWTNQMRKARLLYYIFIAVMFVLTSYFIIKTSIFTDDYLRVFLSSAIILKCFERIKAHYDCHVNTLKTQGACELVENAKCTENIQSLQTMIEERRKIPVLEINFIHKKRAKKISQHYKTIS